MIAQRCARRRRRAERRIRPARAVAVSRRRGQPPEASGAPAREAEGRWTGDGAQRRGAGRLGLTEAEVSAVVSFYTMYKRHPVGEYHIGVCTNTLCAIMGGDQVYASLREHLGVDGDEPAGDGKVSLEHIECNAACDYAPVVMVNWE